MMKIIINNSSMQPLYEQIVGAIKVSIISGELKVHDSLPSVRKLAKDLKISALTVKKAYHLLEEERLLSLFMEKAVLLLIHIMNYYLKNNEKVLKMI